MKKKIFVFLILFLLLVSNTTLASDNTISKERLLPRLLDNAGLLTSEEINNLLTKLDTISENRQVDLVVITVDSLENFTAEEYAEKIFDYYDYGLGADAAQQYLMEEVLPKLSNGEYYQAFNKLADLSEELILEPMKVIHMDLMIR